MTTSEDFVTDDGFESVRIYHTTNYDQFSFMNINRKPNPSHVTKLKNRIKKEGYNKHYPIQVVPADGKLSITSGQHRFLACRDGKLELFYSVIDTKEKDASVLQEHLGIHKEWDSEAILNYYASNDFEHYQRFQAFVDRWNFPISAAQYILTPIDLETGKPLEKDLARKFKSGEFEITSGIQANADELAQEITGILNAREDHAKLKKSSAFIRALYTMLQHPNFDSKRMDILLNKKAGGLRQLTSWNMTLLDICERYNKGAAPSKKVDFPRIFTPLHRKATKNLLS